MSRKTSIITFSVPPELQSQFDVLSGKLNMTKSELFRRLLQTELEKTENRAASVVAENLKEYWQLKEAGRSTILIGSVVAQNEKGQIIITQRAEKDEHIKHLSWTFPGRELKTLDFETEIIKEMETRTGIELESTHIIGARVIPESISSDLTVVSLYFGANFKNTSIIKLDKNAYSSFKLIKPLEVYSYFTTSTSDEINRYLVSLSQ